MNWILDTRAKVHSLAEHFGGKRKDDRQGDVEVWVFEDRAPTWNFTSVIRALAGNSCIVSWSEGGNEVALTYKAEPLKYAEETAIRGLFEDVCEGLQDYYPALKTNKEAIRSHIIQNPKFRKNDQAAYEQLKNVVEKLLKNNINEAGEFVA